MMPVWQLSFHTSPSQAQSWSGERHDRGVVAKISWPLALALTLAHKNAKQEVVALMRCFAEMWW